MNFVAECFVVLGLFLYYSIESIVHLIVPRKKKSVKDQRVLITGAGSGLGRIMSQRFAKLGCILVLWDINEESNEETASQVKELGAKAYTYTVDLSKRDEIYRAADKVKTDVGDIDILVNNAGIVTGKGKFLDSPDHWIQKTMDINATAHCWTVKSFLPGMLRKNKGHIVTIASAAGHFGVNGLADYCASKFAAFGFDESLRAEIAILKKTGVHTTAVCPFYINTGMFTGAKTKWPTLLPILDPNYVVDKIMDAVLTNQAVLCVPRSLYFLIFLKSFIPTKALTLSADFLGLSCSMDEYIGRPKSE